MDRRLYEASLSGSVPTLNTLIEEDELILDRVSVTCFHETPLHIAAMRGHLGFTEALLSRKPKLATELDSLGHSALHLASAEGHVEIVRELLRVNRDGCGTRDQDGRTPLHLAAMKGRVGVIGELIRTRPESAYERLDREETVLHLCVKYYRLDALKYLVESIRNNEFVNSKDHDGNTIFHLAAIFKQMQTIRYLFSREEVKENANAKNVNGFTALDVLDHCPRDVKVMEIREFLLEAGVQRTINHGTDHLNPLSKNIIPTPSTSELDSVLLHRSTSQILVRVPPSSTAEVIRGICMNFPSALKKAWRFLSEVWNKHLKTNSQWLEESRGNLMVAATVTSTMAFQAGLEPPGSVWQDRNNGAAEPGIAIMDTEWPNDFKRFLKYNTVSLVGSLSIILLIISGFPLKNKLSMWLLMAAMSTSVTFMALTYVQSIYMISLKTMDETLRMYNISVYIWIGLCGIVILIHSINILVWVVKKSRKFLISKRWLMVRIKQLMRMQ